MPAPGAPRSKSLVTLIVVASTIAISSIFALVKGVEGAPPLLRSSWRLQSTALVTLPCAYYELAHDKRALDPYRSGTAAKHLALTALGYAAYNMFFSLGLTLACVMHVVIFAQSSPLLIVVFDMARGRPVSRRQLSGCILAFLGAAVSSSEETHDPTVHAPSTAYGIVFSLFAAVGYAIYAANGSRVREHVSLFLYLSPMCAVAAVIAAFASLIAEGATLSTDPTNGLVGWAHPTRLPSVLLIAIIPGVLGLTGVSYGLKFLSALEATVIANLEPLFGTLLGLLLGDPIPGPTVLLGGIVLLAGTFTVVEQHGDASSDLPTRNGPKKASAAAVAANGHTPAAAPIDGNGSATTTASAVFSVEQSSPAKTR